MNGRFQVVRQFFQDFLPAFSRRQVLVAVALVLFLVVVARYGVLSYSSYSEELDDSIDLKHVQYEKYARIVSNEKGLTQLNQSLQDFRKKFIAKHFIAERSPTLAEAAFQNIVKGFAQQANLDVRATKIMPPVEKDGLKYLKMSINTRAEIKPIKDFILQVQDAQQFMSFDQVEIKQISQKENRYFYFNAVLKVLTES